MSEIFDVFISYRRSDGQEMALAIEAYLKSKGLRVFLDVHEMIDGKSFKEQLEHRVREIHNYILIATPDAFKFRPKDDWVLKEIRMALDEMKANPDERIVYPIAPHSFDFPAQVALPDEISDLADQNTLRLAGELPSNEELLRIAKHVCIVNRRNLWHSGQRYFERSREKGGRFHSLDINEAILPMANTEKSKTEGHLDIMVNEGSESESVKLLSALDNQQGNLYLIGRGGIGKTTALVRIMKEHYDDKMYSSHDEIPIFVELNRAPITDATQDFPWCRGGRSNFILREVCRMLRGEDSIRRTSDNPNAAKSIDNETADVLRLQDEFRKKTDKPEYLLLLDGLNEVFSGEVHDVDGNRYFVRALIIDEIKRLLEECPNVRLILTSRTDETEINCEEYGIHKLYLSGVDRETIIKFLTDSGMPKSKAEAACEDERLFECLRIPMFLVMYAKLHDKANVVSCGEIMRRFFHEKSNNLYTQKGVFSRLIKNSQLKVPLVRRLRFVLDFLLPAVACDMEQKQRFQILPAEVQKIIEPILTDKSDTSFIGQYGTAFFKDYTNSNNLSLNTANTAEDIVKIGGDMAKVTQYVLNCAINEIGVMQVTDGKLGFIHHHIRDYFAAVNDINIIGFAVYLQGKEPSLAFRTIAPITTEANHQDKSIFIGEYLGEHHNMPCLKGKVWQYTVPSKDCDRNLLKRALDILRGRFNGEVQYGCYNLIEPLKLVRKDLSGADLSNLDLQLVTLNGTRLGHTETGGANLRGSKLSMENLLCQGHTAKINCVAYSPNGKTLISGSNDNTIKEWDRATGQCIRTYKGHTYFVESVSYNPNGKSFISGSIDKTIKEWNITTGECICTYTGHEDAVKSVTYSPDGKTFISGSEDCAIKEWDIATGQCIRTYEGHSDWVNSVAYSPDGKSFISASHDNTVKEWDRVTGQCICTYEGHSREVNSVAYSPNGKSFISSSGDKTIKEWDIATGQCIRTYKGHSDSVNSVAYSPDGKNVISSSSDKTIKEWNRTTGKCIHTYEEYSNYESYVAYSLDGQSFISSSSDKTIKEWNTATGKCIRTYKGHSNDVNCVVYSPDGKNFIFGLDDGTINKWNTVTCQCICTYIGHNDTVKSIAYSPDGKNFISASNDGTIREWDIATAQYTHTYEGRNIWDSLLLYRPDGRAFIDSTLKEYDIATGKCIRTYEEHISWCSIAYSPDRKTSISVSYDDYTIKEFNVITGQCVRTYDMYSHYVTSAAYSLDGNMFISGAYDKTIKEWNTVTGKCIRTYNGHNASVTSVAYSPDGKYILSGSADGTVRIWSTETGECVQVIRNYPGLIVFGCDMRSLHEGSEVNKDVLRQYGAIVD